MTISNDLLDELLKGCKRPEDLLGDAGLMKELRTAERDQSTEAAALCCCGRRKGRRPFPFLRQQEGREDLQRGTLSQGPPGLRGRHEPVQGGEDIRHLARHGSEDDVVLGATGLSASGQGSATEA